MVCSVRVMSFNVRGASHRGTRFTPSDTEKPTGRIDWILVRNAAGMLRVRSHEIVRDEEAGKYPSDNYPVLANLDRTG